MKGRDKRRRAQQLRERAEKGKSTKDLRVAVAPADLPHNVTTAAPDCNCAGCNPAAWPETNGWRCEASKRA